MIANALNQGLSDCAVEDVLLAMRAEKVGCALLHLLARPGRLPGPAWVTRTSVLTRPRRTRLPAAEKLAGGGLHCRVGLLCAALLVRGATGRGFFFGKVMLRRTNLLLWHAQSGALSAARSEWRALEVALSGSGLYSLVSRPPLQPRLYAGQGKGCARQVFRLRLAASRLLTRGRPQRRYATR